MTGRHQEPQPPQTGAQPLHKIWIDPSSGSWGAGKTVDYEVTDDEIQFLDNASDSEIINFAVRLIREGR